MKDRKRDQDTITANLAGVDAATARDLGWSEAQEPGAGLAAEVAAVARAGWASEVTAPPRKPSVALRVLFWLDERAPRIADRGWAMRTNWRARRLP